MPKLAMSQGRWTYLALAVLLLGGLVVAARIIYPPVKVVVMTTGAAGSAYDVLGQQYKALLARDGIELRLEPSAGAVENLQRLNDPRSGVSVGFSQGGLTNATESKGLVSL